MTRLNAELYDALIAIKVPEKKARAAAAEAIGATEHLATKADVAELKARIHMMIWIGGIAFALIIAMQGYVINLIITLIAQ